jgi:hypothetical protein
MAIAETTSGLCMSSSAQLAGNARLALYRRRMMRVAAHVVEVAAVVAVEEADHAAEWVAPLGFQVEKKIRCQ